MKPLARSSAIIAAATLLTKVTGLLRVATIAARLGASRPADAFLTAFLVPECIYVFLTEGGLVAALVPSFTRALAGGASSFGRLLGSALAIAASLGLVLALGAHLGAGALARVLAMRFDPASLELTASLLSITALYLPLVFAAAVLFAAHNARDEFLIPALGPLAFNLAVIAAALRATPGDVMPLAWGVVLGGAAQLALQLGPLLRSPVPISLGPHPDLARAGSAVGPLSLAVAVGQIQIVAERVVASGLPEGTITTLNLVSKLVNLPVGLLGMAVSTPLVPAMAAAWQREDRAWLKTLIERGHRVLSALVLPATVALVAARGPLVHLLFGHGAFHDTDARLAADLLISYGPSLLGMCGILLWTGAFLATDDALTPSIVRTVWLVVNVGLNFALMSLDDPATIAVTASVTSVGAMVTLIVLAGRRDLAIARGPLVAETALLGVAAGLLAWGQDLAAPGGARAQGIGAAGLLATVSMHAGATLALWPFALLAVPAVRRAVAESWRELALRRGAATG